MPTIPSQIIDLHTHLFNARSLPLAGIFANVMNEDASDSHIARILATLINKITESEFIPDSTEQANSLVEVSYVDLLTTIISQEINAQSSAVLGANIQLSAEQIHQSISSNELTQILTELENSLAEKDEINQASLASFTFENLDAWIKRILESAMNLLQKFAQIGDEIQDYGAFIFSMLSAETRMAETLIRRYGENLPKKMRFVHHMMDMQMGYVVNETTADMVAPEYPFYDRQLTRMKSLAQHFNDRIIGFAAFDPRRENCMSIFDAAITLGFKGFKFYTSMGYLPIGNEDGAVEHRVLEFFKNCEIQQIPVFTHCTPEGFQTRFKLGLNAMPSHWEKLLIKFPELRLCFGHAGGGRAEHKNISKEIDLLSYGWVANEAEWNSEDDYVVGGPGIRYNFAKDVARLCKKYPNVFCEFAYITELIEGDGTEDARARFVGNLLRNLEKSKDQLYDFADKIAYGSDWNMPSMVVHPRTYLDVFLELFDDNKPLEKYREKFFWKNAYTFLKLPIL